MSKFMKILLSFLVIITIASLAVLLITFSRIFDPVVKVEEAHILNTTVCSTKIEYFLRITYKKPAVSMSVRSVFSIDNNITAIWDSSPRYTVISTPGSYHRNSIYLLPELLSPGNYELLIGIQAETGGVAFVRMPFIVPENCP